jgi:hypothetical protein
MTSQAQTGSARRTAGMNHARTRATDSHVPEISPVVHWPEPSPLSHWWTEVMDGALTPIAAPPVQGTAAGLQPRQIRVEGSRPASDHGL